MHKKVYTHRVTFRIANWHKDTLFFRWPAKLSVKVAIPLVILAERKKEKKKFNIINNNGGAVDIKIRVVSL